MSDVRAAIATLAFVMDVDADELGEHLRPLVVASPLSYGQWIEWLYERWINGKPMPWDATPEPTCDRTCAVCDAYPCERQEGER